MSCLPLVTHPPTYRVRVENFTHSINESLSFSHNHPPPQCSRQPRESTILSGPWFKLLGNPIIKSGTHVEFFSRAGGRRSVLGELKGRLQCQWHRRQQNTPPLLDSLEHLFKAHAEPTHSAESRWRKSKKITDNRQTNYEVIPKVIPFERHMFPRTFAPRVHWFLSTRHAFPAR